jgi:hypothetical protein
MPIPQAEVIEMSDEKINDQNSQIENEIIDADKI